jgi:hypothetical protein
MKKQVFTVALLAVLGAATVGCQKENIMDTVSETSISEAATVYTMKYTLNGIAYTATLNSEEEYSAFMLHLMALAREGNIVEIRDANRPANAMSTKEVVTYTTSDEKDAITWSAKMIADGYSVTITYDPNTNIYTCTARN